MSIVLHIPHASKNIPDEYLQYFTLSKKDLQFELLKMTDHFTDELFDVLDDNIHQLNGNSLKNVENIKDELINKFYKTHHENFIKIVDTKLKQNNKVLIIDCHSFPKYPLPYELNQEMDRPEICIGTDNFHTSVKLKNSFGELFEKSNFTVKYNAPFKGSIVPLKFYNKEKRVQSIMIEVRRDLYMDEHSGQKNKNFNKIKKTLEKIINVYLNKHR